MMKAALLLLFAVSVYCTNPCSVKESLNISGSTVSPDGTVTHNGILYPQSTWYEMEEGGIVSLMVCPCIGRTCLWKCCPKGLIMVNGMCKDSRLYVVNPFSPPVFNGTGETQLQAFQHFFLMYNHYLCQDRYMVDSKKANEELYIQANGTLLEISRGNPQWHVPTMYCADFRIDSDNPNEVRLVAAVCFPDTVSNTDDSPVLYIAYAVGLLLSVPFLLATFLVYALIPDLRNLHGMCLMAYCAGLMVAYLFLAYLKVHQGSVDVAMTGCLVVAFIVYYAFQTSFFWLNVMCFDIWRTFSGYRGGSSNKRREHKRFALYGAYAWGVPLALAACTIGMQFADLPHNIIKPGFGHKRCWFTDWLSELVYFFIPVLVLVVCNVVLFAITSYRIRSIRQETAILKGAESARSDKLKKDKQRYALYLKLFVVMGVNWSVELVSFVVGGSNWYWILVDISNIALGFFIFFIFVWKKKVRNLVAKRFRTIFGLAPGARDSRKSPWPSSSHTEDTRVSTSTDDPSFKLKETH